MQELGGSGQRGDIVPQKSQKGTSKGVSLNAHRCSLRVHFTHLQAWESDAISKRTHRFPPIPPHCYTLTGQPVSRRQIHLVPARRWWLACQVQSFHYPTGWNSLTSELSLFLKDGPGVWDTRRCSEKIPHVHQRPIFFPHCVRRVPFPGLCNPRTGSSHYRLGKGGGCLSWPGPQISAPSVSYHFLTLA